MRGLGACGALAILLAGCSDASAVVGEADDAATDGAATTPDATVWGGDAGDAALGPCPSGMLEESADSGVFCIDRYEGAIAIREADGGYATYPHEKPVDGLDASALRAVPADHAYPQGYISQEQAAAACASSGKRLCTLAEWTAACRSQPAHDFVYPYGDTYEPGACNEGKESPIIALFGPTPSYSYAELNDPRCDEMEGGVAPGGSYAGCVTEAGAFDMHGNLHQWIDDSPNGDVTKGSFMGGYFVDGKLNGPGCEYRTTAHAKTYHDYSTGFRCCADAK